VHDDGGPSGRQHRRYDNHTFRNRSGTVAWTVVSDHARAQAAKAAAAARSVSPISAVARHAAYQHALAAGFDRAFLVAAAIAAGILVVAITVIRVRRADLAGS
jgi:hypothetical protein